MKKKPTKLEAKVAELEKKVQTLTHKLDGQCVLLETINRKPAQAQHPKEPETFEDCVNLTKIGYGLGLKGVVHIQCGEVNDAWREGYHNGAIVPSEKRAKQLAAIAKMMTVADALNGDWKLLEGGDASYIVYEQTVVFVVDYYNVSPKMAVAFKNKSTAEKAIKILGEETIKTSFGL